jgi:drug/metabolite transporter (DMT)-like permease
MFVTGMGQVFSAVGGWALGKAGMMPMRPTPPAKYFCTKLVPIIACTAGTMFTGNVAYLYLSVAFIQILKAFTPAVTMLLCLAFKVEKLSMMLVSSITLITLGTAAAVLIESGTAAFSLLGFLYFMASSATEAGRVVTADLLLGEEKYNTAEALVYIGGPAALALLAGSAIWEGQGIMAIGLQMMADHPLSFISAFFISFLVNLTCFWAIQCTSSLTFKVAGCVKNVAVVWYGVLFEGEIISGYQMLGYLVSMVGFGLYTRLKMYEAKPKKDKEKKQ